MHASSIRSHVIFLSLAVAMAMTLACAMPALALDGEGPGDGVAADRQPSDAAAETGPSIIYQAHVQDVGWQEEVADGQMAGTSGRALRLEAIRIRLAGAGIGGSAEYRAHVQDVGWEGAWSSDGALSGSVGSSRRLEAVQIRLSGPVSERYDVWYRVHVQGLGWLGWAKDGAAAGTTGCSLRIEAIEVRLARKGAGAPGGSVPAFLSNETAPELLISTLSDGEDGYRVAGAGAVAGTTGAAKALTALRAKVSASGISGSISYAGHLADVGWTQAVADDALCGNAVARNALQAVTMSLTGDLARYYDVWYQAHAAGYGWLGWAKDGAPAGTQGLGRNLEAIRVRLTVKGAPAPGATTGSFIKGGRSMREIVSAIAGTGGGLQAIGTGRALSVAAVSDVRSAIAAIRSTGRQVGFVMIDLSTGEGLSYDPDAVMYIASSIKGPYVAAINKYHADQVGDGTRSTMESTIRVSSNEGYRSLRRRFGSEPLASLAASVGGVSFDLSRSYPYMPAKDLAKLWAATYDYFFLEVNENSAWCRSLYTAPYLSFIHGALGGYRATYTKPGWISEAGYVARNDAGIVVAGGRPYVVAVMSTAYGQDQNLSRLVRALDAVHDAL